MTEEISLPEYDEEALIKIWNDDHDDFERVGSIKLEDPTRWGYSASSVVKHQASGTFWMLTADISCGDEGRTHVDDGLARVYPHEVTVIQYLE